MSDEFNYPPKPNCRHCDGSGQKTIKPGVTRHCICRFVSHDASDEMGTLVGQAARRIRQREQSDHD